MQFQIWYIDVQLLPKEWDSALSIKNSYLAGNWGEKDPGSGY